MCCMIATCHWFFFCRSYLHICLEYFCICNLGTIIWAVVAVSICLWLSFPVTFVHLLELLCLSFVIWIKLFFKILMIFRIITLSSVQVEGYIITINKKIVYTGWNFQQFFYRSLILFFFVNKYYMALNWFTLSILILKNKIMLYNFLWFFLFIFQIVKNNFARTNYTTLWIGF